MASFLVTGARGFIGGRLVSRLEQRGDLVHKLNRSDGDIADASIFSRFEAVPIDRVYHTAACTFVPESWKDPVEFSRINVGGTINVLEFCKRRSIPLTYVSAYLYGSPSELPIREAHPLQPNNPYALSKVMAESACEFYARVNTVPVCVIRPFNVIGIGQERRFLIPTIIEQVLGASEVRVQDLVPKRDYLHVDDLIDLLETTHTLASGFHIYNAGSGCSLSVGEIIAEAQSLAGTLKPVRSSNSVRAQEIPDTRADISKAGRELGWRPTRTLQEALAGMMTAMRGSK